jgi:hypothetical protein
MNQEWTKNDWQRHQEKVILEEYMEHIAIQNREMRDEKGTISRFGRALQTGERAGEARV